MALKPKIAVAVVALVLVGAGFLALRTDDSESTNDEAVVASTDEVQDETERRRRRAADTPDAAPEPVQADPAQADEEPQETPKELLVRTNVPGARVRVEFHHYGGAPDPEPSETVAGEDGTARFSRTAHPTELVQMQVECHAEGYGPEVATTTEDEIEITLEPALLLAGVVRSDNADALEDVALRSTRDLGAETDADGRFSMYVVGDSEVVLNVTHAAHRPTQVTAHAGGAAIDIVLQRGEQISGSVSWPSGDPAVGVRVSSATSKTSANTDADGLYVLTGLLPGEAEIACQGVGGTRSVAAGAAGVHFVLERHGVRLRFADEEGRAFRHVSVWVRATRDGGMVYTSAGSWNHLERGMTFFEEGTTVKVAPSAPGHADEVTKLELTGEPAPHELEVVLRRGSPRGVIALRATDSAGTPLRVVFIDMYDDAGSPVSGWYEREVALDADGRALLEGVPPGELKVAISTTKSTWSAEGYGMRTEDVVRVLADAETPLTAAIRDGGRVRVTARDVRGEVIAPKELRLFREDGKQVWSPFLTVRGPGSYTTALDDPVPVLFGSPVTEGRYRVVAMPGTSQETELDIVIAAGRTEEVDLVIPDAAE